VLEYWLIGLAMMLVVEGIVPFLFPALWRESFRKLIGMADGQIRFFGLSAILLGLLLLYWVK
jgi:uncharacterized protein YjeT (DUF2065 family)